MREAQPGNRPGSSYPIEREGQPDLGTRFLTGVGLGWICLPLFLMADDAARGGMVPIEPVLLDAMFGVAVGLLIGTGRLGWPGLIGVFGGAIVGAALPYLATEPFLGITPPNLEGYGKYPPVTAVPAVAASFGMVITARSRLRFKIRPIAIVVTGFVVLALWFLFWVVWAQAVRQR